MILFLDINGVFTMTDYHNLSMERVGGIHCRPVPMANALLQAIQSHHQICPVWLTSWDMGAHAWNDRSGTGHWPVARHLTEEEDQMARIGFAELFERRVDEKLIIAHYFLWSSLNDGVKVVWMKNGFVPETVQWAKQRTNIERFDTILLDTTEKPIRSQLSSTYDDYDVAAKEFIEKHIDHSEEH